MGELLEERVDIAIQLADAIAYLHKQNVVHRDLKPDNIGFDKHGTLKVFDFDLARVAPRTTCTPGGSVNGINVYNNDNETFHMTQRVGSKRYMSPECARREQYNLKTDVYSYGLLFHQIITLEKPYNDISDDDHDEFVFYKYVRPRIPEQLPNRTKRLLFHSWARTISMRPTMNIVCQVLKEERTEIIQFGSPSVSMSSSSSVSTPPPSSMSYVASCSFSSLSDCNVIQKTEKKKNALVDANIRTNSSSSSSSSRRSSSNNSNRNNSSSKNKTKPKGQFPSRFRQLRPMIFKKTTINVEKKIDEIHSMVVPISKSPLPPMLYTGTNAKAA